MAADDTAAGPMPLIKELSVWGELKIGWSELMEVANTADLDMIQTSKVALITDTDSV